MSPRRLLLILTTVLAGLADAGARDVKVAVGHALPPYIFPETGVGIEIDIVRQALAPGGFEVEPVYLPLARVPHQLAAGKVDAALTISASSGLENVHYSDSHVAYRNVAVSLAQSGLRIDSVADLAGKSVIGFQNATAYLGEEFAAVATANRRYSELADQERQVKMLCLGRAQVIVADVNIYRYYSQNTASVDTTIATVIHPIFPATPYQVAFLDPDLRDRFNRGLAALRESGEYAAIIAKYVH